MGTGGGDDERAARSPRSHIEQCPIISREWLPGGTRSARRAIRRPPRLSRSKTSHRTAVWLALLERVDVHAPVRRRNQARQQVITASISELPISALKGSGIRSSERLPAEPPRSLRTYNSSRPRPSPSPRVPPVQTRPPMTVRALPALESVLRCAHVVSHEWTPPDGAATRRRSGLV